MRRRRREERGRQRIMQEKGRRGGDAEVIVERKECGKRRKQAQEN